jgi:hypothetical protein
MSRAEIICSRNASLLLRFVTWWSVEDLSSQDTVRWYPCNTLRVLSTLDPPCGVGNAKQLVDTAITEAVYATCSTCNSALKTTARALTFGRDMILNIPLITDLQQLQRRHQELIDQRLIAANKKDSLMIMQLEMTY